MPSTCLQVLKQMALTPVISKHPGTLYQDASNTHSSVCTHRLRGVQGGVLLITFLPNKISTEIPECTAYICLFQVFPQITKKLILSSHMRKRTDTQPKKITSLLFVSQFNLEGSIKKLLLCYVPQTLLNINTLTDTLHNFH